MNAAAWFTNIFKIFTGCVENMFTTKDFFKRVAYPTKLEQKFFTFYAGIIQNREHSSTYSHSHI